MKQIRHPVVLQDRQCISEQGTQFVLLSSVLNGQKQPPSEKMKPTEQLGSHVLVELL